MTDAMRRGWRRPVRSVGADAGRDAGMTLVEVLIACTILMILAMGVFGVMLTAFKTTKNDRTRVAASNLAAREVEIVRQTFGSGSSAVNTIVAPANNNLVNPDPLSGAAGSDSVVDGIAYHVVRTVDVQLTGPGASPCDGGIMVGHPSYSVTATVTWTNMGVAQPVKNQTVLTPQKNVVPDSTYGYLAVKVIDVKTNPVSGIAVKAVGPAGTYTDNTDASGCAVLTLNQPGLYTASVATSGYVDMKENPAPVLASIDVQTGALVQKTFNYDRAAELDATFTTTAGYSLPTTLPAITYANTGIFPSGTKTVSSAGTTTQLKNLWPYVAGYTLWAGSCADADPATESATRNAPSVIAPGGVAATTVTLMPVDVTVLDTALNPAPNQTVTATEQTTTGCGADKVLTLGTTGATGKLKASLPYGKWKLSVGAKSGGVFSVTGTVTPVSSAVDL